MRLTPRATGFKRSARLALALLLCCAGESHAHELWLQPEDYAVRTGQIVSLHIGVGMGWHGELRSVDASRVVRLGWLDAQGERAMSTQGTIRTGPSGPAWGVFRSNRAGLTLDADAFEAYLRDEGLEAVISARRLRGESAAHGRELYSRCAKTLVQVGQTMRSGAFVATPVGLTLELVPQNFDRTVSGGEPFRVRLLYEGAPLAGALVKAFPKDIGAPVSARTDAQGLAVLPISSGGIWMLNAVHMVRAAPHLDADWESIWSSLTMRVPRVPQGRFEYGGPRPTARES